MGHKRANSCIKEISIAPVQHTSPHTFFLSPYGYSRSNSIDPNPLGRELSSSTLRQPNDNKLPDAIIWYLGRITKTRKVREDGALIPTNVSSGIVW